ncbi:MAG: exodeoxyribonuclease VII large subunit [Dehalococcoidia bacterium]
MRPIYQVSQVATYLKELLASDLHLADLWIEGEVSNLSRSSAGHTYFTLKDERAQVRCVMFRDAGPGADALENGAQVVAHGRVSFYEVRGDLQFYVDYVHAAGVGVLHLQFERLKAQLESEGLFDETRKRPLPQFPRRIGVVTSPTGAVFHDIGNVVGRRWPLAEVVLAPTTVQGAEAALGVVAALQQLNAEPEIDAIIVARGGGSLEELWAFNEEGVARAIYASRVPVVSGVGHETDYTIVDLVADSRAPTPSAAAELVVPDRQEVASALRGLAVALTANATALLAGKRALCEQLYHHLGRQAPDIDRDRLSLDELWGRAGGALERALTGWRQGVEGAGLRLTSLSPAATLQRGYALVRKRGDGQVVTSTAQVKTRDSLDVHVADGRFPADVSRQYGF